MSKLTDIKNKGLEFITFSTTWCPDCTMMKPVIANVENWAKDQGIDITFHVIDADENNLYKTDNSWEVLKVPSFFLLKDGVKEHIGYEYLPMEFFTKVIEAKK